MITKWLYQLKKHKVHFVFGLLTLFLIVSCSTVSPFRKNGGAYSTLPSVFGRDGELVILINKRLLVSLSDENEVTKRAEFLSIMRDENGIVIGALEGEYLTDVIRYATGKNHALFNGYNIIQPDSGVFLFTNADIGDAYERIIKNRKNIISENELKERFKNSISVFGKNVRNLFGNKSEIDNIIFNKIDINFNNSSDSNEVLVLNGTIQINDHDNLDKFYTYFKTWYIAELRKNHISFDLDELEKSIVKSSDGDGGMVVVKSLKFPRSSSSSLNLRAILRIRSSST